MTFGMQNPPPPRARTYGYMPGIHVTVISLYVTILRALISYSLVLFQCGILITPVFIV